MAARAVLSALFNAVDGITAPVKKMDRSVSGFSRSARKSFESVNPPLSKIKGLIGGIGLLLAARKIKQGLTDIIGDASMVENATAAYTPLMGSVKKATELVDALNETAATTPFQFDNISSAAGQLLPVMNKDIEKTISTFRMLGDTAGGNAEKLGSITRGFTKSMLKGKVDLESLNMIAEAGVPIFDQLANQLGVSTKQMFKMVSAGQVTTDQLTNTFRTMTSEGGIFYRGMEIASQTLDGMKSTMEDTFTLTKAELGGAILPLVKSGVGKIIEMGQKVREWAKANKEVIRTKITDFLRKIKSGIERIKPGVTKIIQSFKKFFSAVGEIVKVLFEGLIPGGKKAGSAFDALANIISFIVNVATILIKTLKPIIRVLKPIAIAIGILVVAIKTWIIVQTVINFLLTANPIGLIIVGIGALIAIIIALVQNWDKVKAVLMKVWNWFSKLLDNPFIAAAAMIFAPVIGIPAMIIKHWEPIKNFFVNLWGNIVTGFQSGIEKIKELMEKLKNTVTKIWDKIKAPFEKIGKFLGIGGPTMADKIKDEAEAQLIGRNDHILESRHSETYRSTLDVNLNNLPYGSSVKQTGRAPNVNINRGTDTRLYY